MYTCTCVCIGGRELLDIRSRLQHNTENQRLVAREADHLQLEMMAQDTQTKMKVPLLMRFLLLFCYNLRPIYTDSIYKL